jgi:hypothetical protein
MDHEIREINYLLLSIMNFSKIFKWITNFRYYYFMNNYKLTNLKPFYLAVGFHKVTSMSIMLFLSCYILFLSFLLCSCYMISDPSYC